MNPYGQLHKQLQQEILRLADHYGMDHENIRDVYWERTDSILSAASSLEATQISKAVQQSFLTACLAQWAKGKIRGPATPENLEKQAKQAENLSKLLESKGNIEASEKQKKRAEALTKAASKKKPAS